MSTEQKIVATDDQLWECAAAAVCEWARGRYDRQVTPSILESDAEWDEDEKKMNAFIYIPRGGSIFLEAVPHDMGDGRIDVSLTWSYTYPLELPEK
jgi:hypothetical protein